MGCGRSGSDSRDAARSWRHERCVAIMNLAAPTARAAELVKVEHFRPEEPTPPSGPEDYGYDLTGHGTSEPARPRFTPIALDDVTISADPPWLIDGLMPARGLACVIGEPKCGKSFMTSDML